MKSSPLHQTAERHTSWLELFFDLVYVLAIAELAHYLHDHLTASGALGFVFLFVPVWSAWTGYSSFADLLALDGPVFRVTMFAVMLLSLALAVTVHDALTDASTEFAVTYIALRGVLVVLYAWAWRARPQSHAASARYVVGFGVAVACWSASLFFPAPVCFWLWALGLAIELTTPFLAQIRLLRGAPVSPSHLPERFGLFTMIVLGEAIVVTGLGVADTDWALRSVIVATFGFAVVACLWWWYFDRVDEGAVERAYTGNGRTLVRAFGWAYGHFAIYAALTAAAVGLQLAIVDARAPAVSTAARAALCGGTGGAMLGMTLVQALSSTPPVRTVLAARIAVAVMVLALGWAGTWLAPVVLVGAITTCCVAVTAFETTRPKAAAGASVDAQLRIGASATRLVASSSPAILVVAALRCRTRCCALAPSTPIWRSRPPGRRPTSTTSRRSSRQGRQD